MIAESFGFRQAQNLKFEFLMQPSCRCLQFSKFWYPPHENSVLVTPLSKFSDSSISSTSNVVLTEVTS